MIEPLQKEELSFSYLNSICAYNGISVEEIDKSNSPTREVTNLPNT